METTLKHSFTKKELGQFFSGRSVASLLSHLAHFKTAQSIIDPMCGTGDMLTTCLHLGGKPELITGVEVDKSVCDKAIESLKTFKAELINANVFSLSTILRLVPHGYDLVITNPPYVRYQTISGNKESNPLFLDTSEIRKNLHEALSHFQTLNDHDRELLKGIISHYSGLSDLAVPSWILCSMLVKEGGRIAIVVPETWLSRDYALIIKYLLLRLFKIEYVIEDANSSWFLPTQVKTTLIVAKRIPQKESILKWRNESFLYAAISSKAMSKSSLVGALYPESTVPEQDFINALAIEENSLDSFRKKKIMLTDFADDLKNVAANKKWFKLFEQSNSSRVIPSGQVKISSELRQWYSGSDVKFCYLNDIGVSVSQGLRTGANFFFYFDFEGESGNEITVLPNRIFKIKPFKTDRKYFREVVRKQSELNETYSLDNFKAKGVVLYLQSYVTKEDLTVSASYNPTLLKKYNNLPEDLNNYITAAANFNISKTAEVKLISELSAVKPNIRKSNEKRNAYPRFWYMLPTLTKRHFPDLFVPRVNSLPPKTRLNRDGKLLIDANFSSLWISDERSIYDSNSLLALLNSSWAVVAMEEYGTVMGGGALKLEATQLKNIPFPVLSKSIVEKLSSLGKSLSSSHSNHEDLISEIDYLIVNSFNLKSKIKIDELQSIKNLLHNKRISN